MQPHHAAARAAASTGWLASLCLCGPACLLTLARHLASPPHLASRPQVHDELMSAGWDANHSKYYKEIDRRVRAAFPAKWAEYEGRYRRTSYVEPSSRPGSAAPELHAVEEDGALHSGRVSRSNNFVGNGREEGDELPAKPAGAGAGRGAGTARRALQSSGGRGGGVRTSPPPRTAGSSSAGGGSSGLRVYLKDPVPGRPAQPGGLLTPAVQAAIPRHLQYRRPAMAGGITAAIFGGDGHWSLAQQAEAGAAAARGSPGSSPTAAAAAAAGAQQPWGVTPLLLPSESPVPQSSSLQRGQPAKGAAGELYDSIDTASMLHAGPGWSTGTSPIAYYDGEQRQHLAGCTCAID